MATSDSLLARLKTVLEGINGATPYTTTVNKVVREGRTWDEVELGERIFIGIQKGRSRTRYFQGGMFHVTLEILLTVHIDRSLKSARDTELDDVVFDVITALGQDVTLDNNCIECRVEEWHEDEGDPEATGTAEILLRAIYPASTGAC